LAASGRQRGRQLSVDLTTLESFAVRENVSENRQFDSVISKTDNKARPAKPLEQESNNSSMTRIIDFFKILGIIILSVNSNMLLFGQQISGRVFEMNSNLPIEHVHIGIVGHNFGAVSDQNGKYTLQIFPIFHNDTLRFSSIGYHSYSIKVSDFLNMSNMDVALEKRSYDLSDVVVRPSNHLNLDFEHKHDHLAFGTYMLPLVWYAGSDGPAELGVSRVIHPDEAGYKVFLDSIERHSGKYSLKMEMHGDKKPRSYGLFSGTLRPIEVFLGKRVEYRGWIKTQDARNGSAVLWLNVYDDNGRALGSYATRNRGLTGDNEWTQVSVRIRVNRNAKRINYGGWFDGEGTVWFDNLELYINGKIY